MARRGKKKLDDKIEDLNLVPIMNLVVCLIPMVLFGASFIQIGVVNVNTPKFGLSKSVDDSNPDEKPLNLTLAIGEDGFRITANAVIPGITGPEGGEAVAADTGPTIPKKGDEYNYLDLYNKLVLVKNQFPEETVLNMTADAATPFKYLIRAMDTLRVRLEEDQYSDLAALQSATVKIDANSSPELLWPDVVLAVAQ